MGAATAWALRCRGIDVLVLEQFAVGHGRGSSHGAVRIFRLAHAEPSFVRLAQRALGLWRELEAESGTTLVGLSGLLETGGDLEAHRRALRECGAPFEEASARSFGPWRFEPGEEVLLQPEAGVVYAERAQRAFLAGVEVVEGARVEGIDGARLETSTGPISAQAVVVTAGAWARRLLAPLGIELPVRETRETVAYFPLAGTDPVPSMIDWGAGPHLIYGLGGGDGELKVGRHMAGPLADPDEEGRPDEETVRFLAEWVGRRCPAAGSDPIRAETCLYTTTPEESFVLERHGRVVVGSACSGHGFKFAPAIGESLAGLAEEAAVRTGRL